MWRFFKQNNHSLLSVDAPFSHPVSHKVLPTKKVASGDKLKQTSNILYFLNTNAKINCKAMDFIHKLINILLPPLAIFLLLFFLPPYLIFKSISYIIRSYCSENVAGKVVLITGASSGIGEHLAYEYARKGARLALVARREDRLCAVADKSRRLGSPNVVVIPADVSNPEDCKMFIDKAVNYFGRLDHLASNAAIIKLLMFEDMTQISEFAPIMSTNFWGSVYGTHFAVPHLRKSKGKIIVIASVCGWLPLPKQSFYNAAKAALINLYETLRVEFGSDIGITIVTPGLIKTDMVQAEAYTSEMLCPELLEWSCRLSLVGRPQSSKKTY
ncbi:hypothetical protein REPUB_Repub07fG0022400 [Reevesia pubescens]